MKPTEEMFRTAYNGLRTIAESYGVDRNDPDINEFIGHTAEVISSLQAQVRTLYNIMHEREQKVLEK